MLFLPPYPPKKPHNIGEKKQKVKEKNGTVRPGRIAKKEKKI